MGVHADSSRELIEGFSQGWELYRLIAETATDAILLIDEESRIRKANPAAQRLFGYGPELVGQSLTVLMPGPLQDRHLDSIARYRKTGKRNTRWTGVELTGLHRSGREIPVEISFAEATLDGDRFFVGFVRDITQRKQQEALSRYQTVSMSAILETTRELVVEGDLARLLRTIVERATGLLQAAGGGIYLCEPAERQVRCVVSYNTPRDYTGIVLNYGEGAAGRVAETGEPLIISDYSTWEGRAQVYEGDQPFSAVLSVPLKWQDELIGVLHVLEFGKERHFSEQDQWMAAAFASQAAAAVHNARLIGDIQRRSRILSALQEAMLALMARRDLTDVLQEIISQAARLVDASHGYIYLLDPNDHTMTVKVATGALAEYAGSKVSMGEGLAGRVWQTGAPLLIEDYHSWEGRSTQYDRTQFGAVAGVPLTAGGQVVGVLGLAYLERERHFQAEDIDLLNRFGPLASIALENARLYTRLQDELAERNEAQQAVRESEARYRLVSELTSDYSYVDRVEPDGRIVPEWITEAFMRVSGYSLAETQAPDFWQRVVHPDDGPRFLEHLGRALAGEPDTVEIRMVTRDGQTRWLRDSVHPVWSAAEERVTHLYGGAQDVTERRQSEAVQAAVYQIAEAASKAESLDELYDALHGIISRVMPAQNFYIALYDSEKDLISFPYHRDEVDDAWAALPMKPARGLTEYVLRTGQALYCDMDRFEELIREGEVELVGPPSPVWLGVPLIVENKTIGVMALQDYADEGAYGTVELQMLEFVSEQAAKAIERTRLREEIHQHDRVLSALQEATLTLMRELGLDDVLHVILTLAAQLMNTPHGFICLVEPDERTLKVRLGLGRTAEFVGLELQPGEGVAGQIWQTRQPLVIEDYHKWAGRAAALAQIPYRAVAGVPLTSGTKVIGVLGVSYLEAGHTVTAEAVELLNRFGQLASVALANARLYKAAQNELAERRQAEERLRASEERFRALIEHGADQISLLTPEGVLTYENPTDHQPLGYARGAFIGQSIFALLHPDDVQRARRTWEQVLARPGVSLRSSFRLRHADSSWRWMEGTATNLLDDPGVAAIVINYHDSTQQMQAEQALRDSEERFHSLVEHLPAITYTALMDDAHTRVYVSPQAEAMLGISLYEALADPGIWSKMLHPDDRERVLTELRNFYETGRPFVSDYRIVRADGQVFWFHDEAVAVEEKTSHQRFVHGVQMNVTERREAEEEIRRLNAELEQRVHDRTAELEAANRELESFSYSVSHDLRAPLRAIDGYTRLLGSDYGDLLPPEAHEYMKNIREGGRRMSLLIGDLLALSRVSRHVLNYQAVNLSNIAQAIADELQRSSPDRQADFIIARGLTTQADPGLVQILLQNLIGNAWKFSSRCEHTVIEFGALPPSLADPLQNTVKQVFFVRDNGAGFDMAHGEQLFHAFQRLHSNTEFEGTGIGLTIVQRIVERHGGKVWAEGEIDKGAVFYFAL